MIVEPGVKRAASKHSTEKSVPCGVFLCSERPCIHWDQSILGTSANLSNWARLVLPLRGNVWSPNTGLRALFLSLCAAYPKRKSFFLFTKLNQAGHPLYVGCKAFMNLTQNWKQIKSRCDITREDWLQVEPPRVQSGWSRRYLEPTCWVILSWGWFWIRS